MVFLSSQYTDSNYPCPRYSTYSWRALAPSSFTHVRRRIEGGVVVALPKEIRPTRVIKGPRFFTRRLLQMSSRIPSYSGQRWPMTRNSARYLAERDKGKNRGWVARRGTYEALRGSDTLAAQRSKNRGEANVEGRARTERYLNSCSIPAEVRLNLIDARSLDRAVSLVAVVLGSSSTAAIFRGEGGNE